jgi:two-component system, NarL family, nitrate/nitrite response regulator NarL
VLSDLLTGLHVYIGVRAPATAAGVGAFLVGAGLELATSPAGADVSVIDDAWLADPEAVAELSGGVVALGSPAWAATLAELAPAGWAALGSDAGPLELIAGVLAAAVGLAALDAGQVGLLGEVGLDEVGSPDLTEAGEVLNAGLQGGPSLTPREHEVLELLAAGLSNKRAARQLGVSEHTVKFHAQALYAKLGVSSRAAAVTRGVQLGVLSI